MEEKTNVFDMETITDFYTVNRTNLASANRYDNYIIIWIESGNISMTVDSVPIQTSGTGFVFMGKDRMWSILKIQDCKGYIIRFSSEYFCRRASDVRFLQRSTVFDILESPYIAITNKSKIADIISLLHQEYKEQKEFCNEIIRQQLTTLMLLSEREIKQKNADFYLENEEFKQTRMFKKLIEEHFAEIKSMSKYAELMIIPPKRLLSVVSKTTGKTPKQLLNERILLEAKRLLVYCSWSIKEIGYHLGFKEETNFTKFFKQQTGKTPLEFRGELHPFI